MRGSLEVGLGSFFFSFISAHFLLQDHVNRLGESK